jgi:hypothetical protein
MPEIKTEFLFTIALEVQVSNLGDTPYGARRIARFGTGSFEGPKLKGTVLPGGAGWRRDPTPATRYMARRQQRTINGSQTMPRAPEPARSGENRRSGRLRPRPGCRPPSRLTDDFSRNRPVAHGRQPCGSRNPHGLRGGV